MALRCLDSLAGEVRHHGVEVVVVANGTRPRDRRPLDERDDIVLVRSGVNLGFSGGNNLAAAVAGGSFLLLLNDDSIVEEGCIERLVSTAEGDPRIGAVGGRILSADGTLQEAGSVLWDDGTTDYVGRGLPAGSAAYGYLRDVDFVSANGLLVRRQAWEEVGGLDERYFPAYYEDADLCMAVRQHRYRVVYEPRARITHLETRSTTGPFRTFLLRRNRRLFMDKWAEQLPTFDSRPAGPDEIAIDRAVQRARGAPPRLLVVPDRAEGSGDRMGEIIEGLARAGWAVSVSSPAPPRVLSVPNPVRAERLVDLGVDLLERGPGEALTVISPVDAVLLGPSVRWRPPTVVRTDGTVAPVVRIPADGDASSVVQVIDGMTRPPRSTRFGD
jgi:GT2 family glycosyltransferase